MYMHFKLFSARQTKIIKRYVYALTAISILMILKNMRESCTIRSTVSPIFGWGAGFVAQRYAKSIHEEYPCLDFVAPYDTPLFAIITLDPSGIQVTGRHGRFIPPSPKQLGWDGAASSSIKSWSKFWDGKR